MKSLATSLRVLNEFMRVQTPQSVLELSDRLGMQKSQVSKILKTFRESNYLSQDPITKRFSVGINAFALGNNFVNTHSLSHHALPAMRKLVDDTGYSVVLSVMQDSDVIHLLAVEGRLFIDGRWRVGQWMPYHTTSAGRVLLAFGPREVLDYLLRTRGLPRHTPNTIVEPRKFRTAVQKVIKVGIAVTRSEMRQGTGSIAVPVYGSALHAVAALGVICPEHLLTDEEEARLSPMLQRSAREISARLGAEVYPFGN